jgi:phosphate acetyltransferase
MSKAIYIATTESNSGKSLISIGLMQLLLGKTAKVGYFRPIINDYAPGQRDNHIDTILSYFNLSIDYDDTYALTRSDVAEKKQQDKEDEILDIIIKKYKSLEEKFDFVLVEGTDFTGEGAIIEWDINVQTAKNLGIPTIIVVSGVDKTLNELVRNFNLAYHSFKENGVDVLMVVANKVKTENIELVASTLKNELPDSVLVGAIPLDPFLGNPSLKEIVEQIDGKVLFGEEYINNPVSNFKVGAMQLRNYLTHLKEDGLVITPGDRADIILGALQANMSNNYPRISGIVLSGGLMPEASITKLIEGLSDVVPIVSVNEDTFDIVNKIGAIKPKIYAENDQKIIASIQNFSKYIPVNDLEVLIQTVNSKGITPRMFQYNLLKRAQKSKKRIVLPEGTDDRILKATKKLIDANVVDITLIGNKKEIAEKIIALDLDLDLSYISIEDPPPPLIL